MTWIPMRWFGRGTFACERCGEFPDLRPRASFAAEKATLAAFAADGLVTLAGDVVRLTALGRPLMRSVAAVFDARLAPVAARHSRAV